ncbi:hypothetical protein EDB80DRAFT_701551 [Ilyonectria destructans]|nr:hypothetical protein EDB80DRAFT_701551 [Ilyonectria destructans]
MASMTSHQLKKWVWLLNPFTFPIVYDELKKYLNAAELLALSQTSKELGLLRYYTLKKAANVDGRLKDFVHDAPLFRSHLGHDNALISGSFALNVFEMGGLKVRKLDIFVQDGPKADHIMFFVSETEGYRSEDEQDGELPCTINYTNQSRPDVEVRITRTPGPPLQHIMTSSSTTACVNFLSWNKAYSIFPRPTFIQRRLAPLRSLDDELNSTLKKLGRHGWSDRDVLWPGRHGGHETQLSQITGLRRVGDGSTLIIPLDTITGHHTPPFPDSAIEYSQFNIATFDPFDIHASRTGQNWLPPTSFHNMIPPTAFIKVEGEAVNSPALRHPIVTFDLGWEADLKERLKHWAWDEWYRLDADDRPAQDPDVVPRHSDLVLPENFNFPSCWNFADDQIPKWYHGWEEARMIE